MLYKSGCGDDYEIAVLVIKSEKDLDDDETQNWLGLHFSEKLNFLRTRTVRQGFFINMCDNS